jgi:hypothetical protein
MKNMATLTRAELIPYFDSFLKAVSVRPVLHDVPILAALESGQAELEWCAPGVLSSIEVHRCQAKVDAYIEAHGFEKFSDLPFERWLALGLCEADWRHRQPEEGQ